MRVSAKVDYAVRACIELARAACVSSDPVKGERIAEAQGVPFKYLENILAEMRQDGIVRSQRGSDGGYWLARPAEQISVADVIRAVEGPLANVRGERPEALDYPDDLEVVQEMWVATRASLRRVLDEVSLAALAGGRLPDHVSELARSPGAWDPR